MWVPRKFFIITGSLYSEAICICHAKTWMVQLTALLKLIDMELRLSSSEWMISFSVVVKKNAHTLLMRCIHVTGYMCACQLVLDQLHFCNKWALVRGSDANFFATSELLWNNLMPTFSRNICFCQDGNWIPFHKSNVIHCFFLVKIYLQIFIHKVQKTLI